MKITKVIIGVTLLLCTSFFQTITAQKLSKEVKREIRKQEQNIQAKEEMLLSGVNGLKRIKSRLKRLKTSKKATKQELEKKQRVVNSIEKRLSNLDNEIKNMRESLNTYKKRQNIEVETPKSAKAIPNKSINNDLATREAKLNEARLKLEADRKARELAYKKEQERLRLEQEKLAQLDNEIKVEKEKIAKAQQEAKSKALKEKQTKINALEDEISVNEEMLVSGKEGLDKIKSKLETGKKDGSLTQEDINRKQAVITNIEKRLSKMEQEIKNNKAKILKIKNGM